MTAECWWARYPWLIYHPKTLAPQKAKLTHKGNSVDTFYRNMKVNWFHFWKQLLSLPVTGNQNEAHNNPQVCTYKDLSLCIASPSKCNIKSKWAMLHQIFNFKCAFQALLSIGQKHLDASKHQTTAYKVDMAQNKPSCQQDAPPGWQVDPEGQADAVVPAVPAAGEWGCRPHFAQPDSDHH